MKYDVIAVVSAFVTVEADTRDAAWEKAKGLNKAYVRAKLMESFEAGQVKFYDPQILDVSSNEDESSGYTGKKCSCGCSTFYARQKCYGDVLVDGNNIVLEPLEITDAESPYGSYCCSKCSAEYEELNDLPL